MSTVLKEEIFNKNKKLLTNTDGVSCLCWANILSISWTQLKVFISFGTPARLPMITADT